MDERKGLFYGSGHMLWSDQYNAYVWLVKTGDSVDKVLTEAKANISIGSAGNTLVNHGGDVNSSGKVDINDAQLIYELYMNKKDADISQSGMQALLNGDVNCNGKLDTGDARAVVFRIK